MGIEGIGLAIAILVNIGVGQRPAAIGGGDCPFVKLMLKLRINDQAAAGVGGNVDVGIEMRVAIFCGQRAGMMMVEIGDGDASIEQTVRGVGVAIKRNVEYLHARRTSGGHTVE